MGAFTGLKKMFQVGDKIFPASHAAEAMQIKHALEQGGHVGMNRALVDLGEQASPAINVELASEKAAKPLIPKLAAGIGMAGGMNGMPDESTTSPFQLLKQGMGLYKENVVDPIASKAKEVLTPDMNVQGATYKTSQPATDMGIEALADPSMYMGGVGGALAGAAQVIGDLTPEDEKFKNTKRLFGR